MIPTIMKTQLSPTNPAPPIRSSRREEALIGFPIPHSAFRISQSLLTSAATRFDISRQFAFTRAELLTVLAGLALLALVVLPALANNRARSARVICANNLRQIGAAMQLWGNDHNDQLPYALFPQEGGTRLHPLAPNAWFHFSWISNELVSPRLLHCPSDDGRPATDFSGSPDGGYLNPNFANRSTRYFLSHSLGQIVWPTTFISGDRNVGGGRIGGDSVFGTSLGLLASGLAWWSNGLHGAEGNILRSDGAVFQFSDDGFRRATSAPPPGYPNAGLWQFIVPR
jgi:competence protein ComGC